MYEIKNNKKTYKVKIDEDLVVDFKPFMAGTDLMIQQKQRRATFLEKKIEVLSESAKTSEDFKAVEDAINEMGKLESEIDTTIRNMFKASEKDADKLNKWLESMSLSELVVAIKEIGEQLNGNSTTTDTNAS